VLLEPQGEVWLGFCCSSPSLRNLGDGPEMAVEVLWLEPVGRKHGRCHLRWRASKHPKEYQAVASMQDWGRLLQRNPDAAGEYLLDAEVAQGDVRFSTGRHSDGQPKLGRVSLLSMLQSPLHLFLPGQATPAEGTCWRKLMPKEVVRVLDSHNQPLLPKLICPRVGPEQEQCCEIVLARGEHGGHRCPATPMIDTDGPVQVSGALQPLSHF
jgi:hypothetical protein